MPQNPGMWFCLVNSLPISTPSHLKTVTYASKERKFSSALLSWPSISGGKMREYFLGGDDHWGLLVIHRHIVSTWDVGSIKIWSNFGPEVISDWDQFMFCVENACYLQHLHPIIMKLFSFINWHQSRLSYIYMHYPLWFLFEELCFLTNKHHLRCYVPRQPSQQIFSRTGGFGRSPQQWSEVYRTFFWFLHHQNLTTHSQRWWRVIKSRSSKVPRNGSHRVAQGEIPEKDMGIQCFVKKKGNMMNDWVRFPDSQGSLFHPRSIVFPTSHLETRGCLGSSDAGVFWGQKPRVVSFVMKPAGIWLPPCLFINA